MTQFEDSIGTKLYSSIIDVMREQFASDVSDGYRLHPLKLVRAISSSDFESLFGTPAVNLSDHSQNVLNAIRVVDVYANPILEGDEIVTEKDGNLWQVYNNILTHALPAPDLSAPSAEDGYIDVLKSPDYEIHKKYRRDVQAKELEILEMRVSANDQDLITQQHRTILENELADLKTSWILTGKKRLFEKAEELLLKSETVGSEVDVSEDMLIWKQARDKFRGNLITDTLTGQEAPITRIDVKTNQNWQQVTKRFGSDIEHLPELFFFGTNARLLSMSLEFTLLKINRTAWFEETIIQQMNWQWASLYGQDHALTDGAGNGEFNYLPSHIVAVKDVQMEIWVPTQSNSAEQYVGEARNNIPQSKLKIGGFDGRVFGVTSVDGKRFDLTETVVASTKVGSINKNEADRPLTPTQIRTRNLMKERGNIKRATRSRDSLFRAIIQTGTQSTEAALGINPGVTKNFTPLVGAMLSGRKEMVIQQGANFLTGMLRRHNNRTDCRINIQLPLNDSEGKNSQSVSVKIFKQNKRGKKKKLVHEETIVAPNTISQKLHPGLYAIEVEPDDLFLWSKEIHGFRVEKNMGEINISLKNKWVKAVCERLTEDSDLMILGYMAKRLPRLPQVMN